MRDVTDSWPIIVGRFGVLDPLKHSAAKGISNKPRTWRKGMLWLLSVTLIQHCHAADCRRGEEKPHCGRADRSAATTLSGRHFINLSETRRCIVCDCHITLHSSRRLYIWPPLAHQLCFTFYLMNSSHEVISWVQHHSSERLFPFCFFFHTQVVALTRVAPGLIFSLKPFLSNNEMKNLFLAQCYYLPQIKRFPV